MGPISTNPSIDGSQINFGLLHSDINKYCTKEGITLSDISSKKLFRGVNYLSACISRKRIPQNSLLAVLDIIDQPLVKYKLKKEEEKAAVPCQQGVEDNGGGEWYCKLSVRPQFGIVSLAIYHGDKEIAVGHAKIRENTDTEIAKSISYAAHICFKNVEQLDFVNRIGASNPDDMIYEMYNNSVPFKQNAVQYVAERTDRGELARFIKLNYDIFPSWGEKAMRRFLTLNNASKQVQSAFDREFERYIKSCR